MWTNLARKRSDKCAPVSSRPIFAMKLSTGESTKENEGMLHHFREFSGRFAGGSPVLRLGPILAPVASPFSRDSCPIELEQLEAPAGWSWPPLARAGGGRNGCSPAEPFHANSLHAREKASEQQASWCVQVWLTSSPISRPNGRTAAARFLQAPLQRLNSRSQLRISRISLAASHRPGIEFYRSGISFGC